MTIIKLNRLYALLMRFPKEKWDWPNLTCNPNITQEIIERHPEWPWDFEEIDEKCGMTKTFAEKHNNLNIELFLRHSSFSWEDVEKNLAKINLHYFIICKRLDIPFIFASEKLSTEIDICNLSRNIYLTWNQVKAYPELDWDMEEIFKNPSVIIPLDELSHLVKQIKTKESWKGISRKANITMDFVEQHLDWQWNWSNLMIHRWVTPSFYKKYKEKITEKYIKYRLLKNPNFSYQDLVDQNFTDKYDEDNYLDLLRAGKISFEEAKEILKERTVITDFIDDGLVPIEFLDSRLFFPSWTKGHAGVYVPYDLSIQDHWNMQMSYRSDLTCLDVLQNKQHIGWEELSENTFFLRRRAGKVLWKFWLMYKTKKMHKNMMTKVREEISILPACYISAAFPGGEEYRKAAIRFAVRL